LATLTAGLPRAGRTWSLDGLELVAAVACLAVLAAMAIPRQLAVSAEARRAQVVALEASIRSAARFGHSLWQAAGAPEALEAGRGRVTMVNGYPSATGLSLLLEQAEAMAFTHEGGAWRHRDGGAERCAVLYAPPARRGAAPSVEVDVGGC
jgi:hypothetical protein